MDKTNIKILYADDSTFWVSGTTIQKATENAIESINFVVWFDALEIFQPPKGSVHNAETCNKNNVEDTSTYTSCRSVFVKLNVLTLLSLNMFWFFVLQRNTITIMCIIMQHVARMNLPYLCLFVSLLFVYQGFIFLVNSYNYLAL